MNGPAVNDTINLVERAIAEGGDDMSRYLRELHQELRTLREVAYELRLAIKERDECRRQVEAYERFHKKLLEMIDEQRAHDREIARARLS